ncbi:MAG TPA: M20/M25/M40 family metallo-hydrolase [Candidatus Limnocylindrales bacterium]|nr:M20/M25/M40 family metallo-hydrolase [Candidatus Limnocylindrales bacterium]
MIDWDAATDECVGHLRALIRIPSVNPPGEPDAAAGRDSTGGETAAAAYCAEVLGTVGIDAELLEAAPGRGSCFARLPATVANPEPPLILLSHVDVVPVDAESWSHDPFGGELLDGVVWGRGAVDMKDMVAMELSVMLALHRSGAERRRDVIFAALADEEAGGQFGALHWVRHRPDLFGDAAGNPAAAALNEVGGYSMTVGGRRVYAIQVAEKGIIWTRVRSSGTPSHGSMPSPDNAAIKLADAVSRLAADPRPARVIPVVRGLFEGLGLADVADLAASGAESDAEAILAQRVDDEVVRRSLHAMLRDTVTPNVIHAGKKVNVVPGIGEAEIDVRTLPGTDQAAMLAHLQAVAGAAVTVESVHTMPPVEWPADAEIVRLMSDAVRAADPEGVPLPMMITPGTDAKALALLGIPTYGFAPLRLDPDVPFLSLFHGNDERIPVSGLRFGLPVLYEVVSRFVRPGPPDAS